MSKHEILKGTKSGVTRTSTGLLGTVTCGCWGAAGCRTPFPRDPALGQHHTSRATRSLPKPLSSSTGTTEETSPCTAAAPLPASTPEWDSLQPQALPTVALSDPQWFFCVMAQPETQHEDFNSRRQQCDLQKRTPRTQHHRQYESVDYTHSAQPALLLGTSCQFSTGTGILVSMKLSWCWRAPRGLLSMRRMGLFWIVSTRSRWGKKKT